MFIFVLCFHESNVSNDDRRRRRYGAARERKEFYESLAIIRNRVCGEEEGEVRRSSDEEEEIRTKSVVQSVLCCDVSLIVYNYRVRSGCLFCLMRVRDANANGAK